MSGTPRFFYLRDHDGHPVGVVAMRRELDAGAQPYGVAVRVAMSVCAPSDRFDKRIGIARAIGRLDSERQSTDRAWNCGSIAYMLVRRASEMTRVDWARAERTFDAQRARLLAPKDDT